MKKRWGLNVFPWTNNGLSKTRSDGPSVHSPLRRYHDGDTLSDPFAPPPGPPLGRQLRGPLRSKGVVFGRELKLVVSETAAKPGGGLKERDKDRQLLLELETTRLLPAVVARCAQYLLMWGLQEEGLFRVSGRPTHVAKLRKEFDTGADYDLMESLPEDLDLHAVASLFKAFLRELPETILTRTLQPSFDAVINAEAEQNTSPQHGLSALKRALRKPPSLSTLAMPNFNSAPPPSESLILAIRTLVSQLPKENKDLLKTVVDIINATVRESKKTKMPMSNILLVFSPSLNMTPPLLKALCEAEGIWEKQES